ncbi:MAG: lipid-A-disaccharide synthase [Deltaproteobacteria bacterium]|nr:MAG: lipid-A-disaccharide synthase [Deltaproteobacteria bacterium]
MPTRVAKQGKEIMLVVGEASGDIHGANLIKALRTRDPTLKAYGVAGEQLGQTDFEALFSVSKLTGMGFVELAGNLGNVWRAYRLLRRTLRQRRPNLLILVDFPEFNLRLAKLAKALHIPVLYYVSPQIWAWRRGRVRQIARWVDQMAVVFPFEVSFYESHGVKVVFVGHPLLDAVHVKEDRETVLSRLGLDPAKPTIALLPGSRHREVSYHLPVMLEASARLSSEREIQFLVVRADTVDAGELRSMVARVNLKMPVIDQARYDAVNASDLVWTASGTATLETALLRKPMIIVYRLSWLTYCLARLLVRVDHIGMVNLIAGERLVPELVQADLTAQRLIEESRTLLDNQPARSQIIEKLSELREKLGPSGAADRVADLALAMVS